MTAWEYSYYTDAHERSGASEYRTLGSQGKMESQEMIEKVRKVQSARSNTVDVELGVNTQSESSVRGRLGLG